MALCTPYVVLTEAPTWCEKPDITTEEANAYLAEASNLLWSVTGRYRNGICSASVRPVWRSGCNCGPVGFWGVVNGLGGCTEDRKRIRLLGPVVTGEGGPVAKVDGVTIPVTVLDGIWLLRTDGLAWPTAQNLLLPDTDEGTFSISWSYGEEPDPSEVRATTAIARELVRQDSVAGGRRLPANTTSASAQGVNVAFDRENPSDTSLASVQAAIAQFNPLGQTMPPQWSNWDEPWLLHTVA